MSKVKVNGIITHSLGIPVINSLNDLSEHLGVSKGYIYLATKKTHCFYTTFEVKKKNGNRIINSPTYSLKMVQRWILENILYKVKPSVYARAYIRNYKAPLLENSILHRDYVYTLVIDIKDFFPTIVEKKIFSIFKMLGYNDEVSSLLSKLCTFNGILPQGAVTSPHLSNLVAFRLDNRIQGFCSKREITYTRYSDDIMLSCNDKNLLKKAYNVIGDIIKNEGYHINTNKTRYLTPSNHKVLLGITINNEKSHASRELKRLCRSMIYNSMIKEDFLSINTIKGYVNYINSIEPGYRSKIEKYIKNLQYKSDLTKYSMVSYSQFCEIYFSNIRKV